MTKFRQRVYYKYFSLKICISYDDLIEYLFIIIIIYNCKYFNLLFEKKSIVTDGSQKKTKKIRSEMIKKKKCPECTITEWPMEHEHIIILLKLHSYEHEITGIVIIRGRTNKFKPHVKETPG
jgi:hypothetical protein